VVMEVVFDGDVLSAGIDVIMNLMMVMMNIPDDDHDDDDDEETAVSLVLVIVTSKVKFLGHTRSLL
jgi:hypothetical protein